MSTSIVVTGAPCTTTARPPTKINFMSASKSPSRIALRSILVFDLITEQARFVEDVQRGLEDVQNEPVLPDEYLGKEI
jgi:hypothetical protein